MNLAVLMTCHNRRETTLNCLRALFACPLPEDTALLVFLVDDGSSDGTADAVKNLHPEVQILQGDGNLYWNGGMRMAFAAAMERGFDYYLWLNDDTYLYSQTLLALIRVESELQRSEGKPIIVVGSTQAREGERANHGGIVKWTRVSSKLVEPGPTPIRCQTMYGNCVLLPAPVADKVGNLDAAFIHAIGDVDYGLRAIRCGFPIFVMPGFAGVCSTNSSDGTFNDVSLPLQQRYGKLMEPKGLPPRPWFFFLWRHFKLRGLIYGAWIYTKIALTYFQSRITGRQPFP